MAKDTAAAYRNQVIYSVFVRNHTPEGTFEGVRRDLPRIQALGADIIWLLPIHPIGETARKGTLGSPYAISDYRAVNPEYGTLEDFRRLVEEIHALGMKCIIDVVYHHTSPDSLLAREHPHWFYRREDGSFGNKVGDWSDIIDLDYRDRALWEYQIETLCYWAGMVDGFRCDVAPLVPLEFWREARARVEKIRPGCLWLAETVDPGFIRSIREAGFGCLSDCQVFEAFDLSYEYDVYPLFRDYLAGKIPLARYVEALDQQEVLYPQNYVKLRFLENHDKPRAAFLLPNGAALRNWTAFLFFQKGTTLLYAGQEAGCTHLPSLFDRDPVDWSGPDLSPLFRRLCALKKHPLLAEGSYRVKALPGEVLCTACRGKNRQLLGVFSLRGEPVCVPVYIRDGEYENLLGGTVQVEDCLVRCGGEPLIFEVGLD